MATHQRHPRIKKAFDQSITIYLIHWLILKDFSHFRHKVWNRFCPFWLEKGNCLRSRSEIGEGGGLPILIWKLVGFWRSEPHTRARKYEEHHPFVNVVYGGESYPFVQKPGPVLTISDRPEVETLKIGKEQLVIIVENERNKVTITVDAWRRLALVNIHLTVSTCETSCTLTLVAIYLIIAGSLIENKMISAPHIDEDSVSGKFW